MTAGTPCSVPLAASTPAIAGEVLARKHLMRVTREDRVDAGHFAR